MFNFTWNKTLRSLGLMAATLLGTANLQAQEKAQYVFTLGGGEFGNPASYLKCYTIKLGDGSYTKTLVDSVPGQFTAGATSVGQEVYFSAGDVLYHYDSVGTKFLDSVSLPGIFDLAVNGNYLIVSRWFPATGNFVQVLNRTTLATLYSSTTAAGEGRGIAILRDTAYVAINTTDSGRVEVISLSGSTPQYVNTINLDTIGNGAHEVYTDGSKIYIFSSNDSGWPDYTFISAAVSVYTPETQTVVSAPMPATISGIGLYDGKLYGDFGGGVDAYNLTTHNVTNLASVFFTNAAISKIDGDIFLIQTDYVNKDTLFILSNTGTEKTKVDLPTASETLTLVYFADPVTGISQPEAVQFNCYPNPSNGLVYLSSNTSGNYTLVDLQGREILSGSMEQRASINLETLPAGVYYLNFVGESGQAAFTKLIRN